MFASADMRDLWLHTIELFGIRNAIIDARPELAEVIAVDDERPFLLIPYPGKGNIVIARVDLGRVVAWRVVVPDTPETTIHTPSGYEQFARTVLDALDAAPHPA